MAKSKVKGFDLFSDMRKGNQTFADRSDAFNSAVGNPQNEVLDIVEEAEGLSPEQQAVIALTDAVKEYKTTIKGGGLGKKTIDGFKEVVRVALGVKRMGSKRYHQIIDLCAELEVITKDSGRSYFNVVEPIIVEEENEIEIEDENLSDWEKIEQTAIEKKAKADFELYLSDKEEYGDEDGEFVSNCTLCGSYHMVLYLDSKKKLRCNACNDLHWEESFHLFPYQVSSTNKPLSACVRAWGKKTRKGILHKGWLLCSETDSLIRVSK